MVRPEIDEVLRTHKQHHQMSCSVSALEFVAKLYGLIQLDKFPLQEDPKNQHNGFDDKDLQDAVGLSGSSELYEPQAAINLIEAETNLDRFPIVSFYMFSDTGQPLGYHIHVAAKQSGQSILIDPANGLVVAPTTEDLATAIKYYSEVDPIRKTIHILTLRPTHNEAL